MLDRAWDNTAGRWNERRRGNLGNVIERDSAWWMHDEADQTLAALDLTDNLAYKDRLSLSAQTFLDVYVDHDPAFPARETFARVSRVLEDNDLRKSFRGKNMLHNFEHTLIMYLHGRALEGKPARLHYAFPEEQALTAVAKPYWFDAAREFRAVRGELTTLPGHRLVEVEFSGLDAVPAPPFPAPPDATPPVTEATVSPVSTSAGWHNSDVTVSFAASDGLGVKELHVAVEGPGNVVADVAYIEPGAEFTLPVLSVDGTYEITYFAVDVLGNAEAPRKLPIRIDTVAPGLSGLPSPCVIWPPNMKLVHVADVVGADDRSGVARLLVEATANEQLRVDDVRIVAGSVDLRAARDPQGTGRLYTIVASVTDLAGNITTDQAQCLVPRDRGEP